MVVLAVNRVSNLEVKPGTEVETYNSDNKTSIIKAADGSRYVVKSTDDNGTISTSIAKISMEQATQSGITLELPGYQWIREAGQKGEQQGGRSFTFEIPILSSDQAPKTSNTQENVPDTNPVPKLPNSSEENSSLTYQGAEHKTFMRLRDTGEVDSETGLKKYVLLLYKDGKLQNENNPIKVYSGKPDKQNAEGNISGSDAPLPAGFYKIGQTESGLIAEGKILNKDEDPNNNIDPEIGDSFTPITALNPENTRIALGIHQDVSKDGTHGCAGIQNPEDLKIFEAFIASNPGLLLEVSD